ncbi:hypothetical protein RA180_09610 [Aeromonas salmonicida]|uniref:hypothetical protein n=1 Tax=Aeromonas salmonicida TaxID=645 RepID=UPI0027967A06|nr:hypothetical protein [Aeromonas salmonicida]MDQ1884249.1 hypothetical protein [Aeromonas salmonicida]
MAILLTKLGAGNVKPNRLGGLTITKYEFVPYSPSGNKWFISDKGVGILPTLIIGSQDNILAFLLENPQIEIFNQSEELPNIYISYGVYDPDVKRIEVSSPVGDVMVSISRVIAQGIGGAISGMAASPDPSTAFTLVDFVTAIKDNALKAKDVAEWLKLHKKEKPNPKAKQFVLSIYNMKTADNDRWIGNRTAHFSDILLQIFKATPEYKRAQNFFEQQYQFTDTDG